MINLNRFLIIKIIYNIIIISISNLFYNNIYNHYKTVLLLLLL